MPEEYVHTVAVDLNVTPPLLARSTVKNSVSGACGQCRSVARPRWVLEWLEWLEWLECAASKLRSEADRP